jgi:hypothetical protein
VETLGDTVPSVDNIISFYVKPKDGVSNLDIAYNGSLTANSNTNLYDDIKIVVAESIETFNIAEQVAIDNIIVDNSGNSMNAAFTFIVDGNETGAELNIKDGGVTVAVTETFDTIKLQDDSVYDFGVDLNDVISSLKGVAGMTVLEGKAHIAADLNNDGIVNLDDVIGLLKGVSGLTDLKEFNVVNDQNQKMDNFESFGASSWSLVAKGDIDLSGGFLDIV